MATKTDQKSAVKVTLQDIVAKEPNTKTREYNAKVGFSARQGDIVMFFKAEKEVKLGEKIGKEGDTIQLAQGENMGSRHRITLPKGVEAYNPVTPANQTGPVRVEGTQNIAGPMFLVKEDTTISLVHPEHAHHSMTVKAGTVIVSSIQADFSTEQLDRVRD